jgi:UDP-N-acetylmuramoyl-tripeptide--D-alanyl-D-alanine ligase
MMRLSEAAIATQGQLIGQDILFTSVGTDSRSVAAQQLFVALQGEKFDGHDYAKQAFEHGAAGVLIQRGMSSLPAAVMVKDTRLALGDLAAYWRSKFDMPIAAITGSSGKTTVKEMLASILRAATENMEDVLATQGNLNNDIGLPLTMLKLRRHHQYAVLEMGMNHSGEISYLTKLARPSVALLNNAGSAHIGELGSVEAIAKAKGEIFQGLAADGTAIFNADDDFAPLWKAMTATRKQMTFGLATTADVSADYQLQANASSLVLKTPMGKLAINLPVAGLHNVRNALAATSVALAMGVSLDAVAQGLQQFTGVNGRLQLMHGLNGARVIDDTYNANPASMKAAIDVLAAQSGETIFVMGDMGELGEDGAEMHAEIGRYAKSAGIQHFYGFGELSTNATNTFGQGAHHFDEIETLAAAIVRNLNTQTTVLVKGSRFMRMERVVQLVATKPTTQNKEEQH